MEPPFNIILAISQIKYIDTVVVMLSCKAFLICNSHAYLHFVSQPAVGPSCARYRALKITLNKGLLCLICKTAVEQMVFLLQWLFLYPFVL